MQTDTEHTREIWKTRRDRVWELTHQINKQSVALGCDGLADLETLLSAVVIAMEVK